MRILQIGIVTTTIQPQLDITLELWLRKEVSRFHPESAAHQKN